MAAPRCGHRHRPWARGATPTRCPTCGIELWDVETTAAGVDVVTAAYVQFITWLQSGRRITRGALAAGVRAHLDSGEVTPTDLARRTGLSLCTIGALRSGAAAPQLGSIVALLARTNYRLEELLEHGEVEPAAPRRHTRPTTAEDKLAELERVLRHEALRPRPERRTLADICAQFGRGHAYASQHPPHLTEIWSRPGHRRGGRRRTA